jgi:hypothetical protein
MRNFLRFAVKLAAGVTLVAGSALANPITVSNFSFEQIFGSSLPIAGCGPGCSYGGGAIPGWTSSLGTSGQFQPGPSPSIYFNSLTDGNTVAWGNSGGTISQTVAPVVQVGVTYTLLVDLGRRADPTYAFTGVASLLVNGVSYTATGVAPTPGNWSTFTATYIGTAADAGKPIAIQLTSSGSQGEFDNVRLSDSVPEPGVTGMIGAGLVSLALFARRKRGPFAGR